MLHLPDGAWLVAGGAGLFLAGLLTAGAVWLLWRRLVKAVAGEIVKSQPAAVAVPVPVSKHDREHLALVAFSERVTSLGLGAIEDGQVQYARLQNQLLLAEWVRDGGNVNAPWSQIVKWKNEQKEKESK